MAVTIKMIEEKEFKTKANGYDPEEVDEFLNDIMDEFERMEREIYSLKNRAQSAPAAAASTDSLQKLLSNAQRVCDETVADARKQADVILDDARKQADRIVRDAKTETVQLQDNLDTLRSAVNDYRARFKRLLEDQMHVLNAETELFK